MTDNIEPNYYEKKYVLNKVRDIAEEYKLIIVYRSQNSLDVLVQSNSNLEKLDLLSSLCRLAFSYEFRTFLEFNLNFYSIVHPYVNGVIWHLFKSDLEGYYYEGLDGSNLIKIKFKGRSLSFQLKGNDVSVLCCEMSESDLRDLCGYLVSHLLEP